MRTLSNISGAVFQLPPNISQPVIVTGEGNRIDLLITEFQRERPRIGGLWPIIKFVLQPPVTEEPLHPTGRSGIYTQKGFVYIFGRSIYSGHVVSLFSLGGNQS
jgi:hypothetical protein